MKKLQVKASFDFDDCLEVAKSEVQFLVDGVPVADRKALRMLIPKVIGQLKILRKAIKS